MGSNGFSPSWSAGKKKKKRIRMHFTFGNHRKAITYNEQLRKKPPCFGWLFLWLGLATKAHCLVLLWLSQSLQTQSLAWLVHLSTLGQVVLSNHLSEVEECTNCRNSKGTVQSLLIGIASCTLVVHVSCEILPNFIPIAYFL